jgi:hypothetical protein
MSDPAKLMMISIRVDGQIKKKDSFLKIGFREKIESILFYKTKK